VGYFISKERYKVHASEVKDLNKVEEINIYETEVY